MIGRVYVIIHMYEKAAVLDVSDAQNLNLVPQKRIAVNCMVIHFLIFVLLIYFGPRILDTSRFRYAPTTA